MVNIQRILCSLLILLISVAVFAETDRRGLQWQGPTESISTPYLQGNYRAVIIGNSQYKDEHGVWKSLATPVKDADSVASLLQNDYGFRDVTKLQDASRREILLALNDLSKRVEPNDNVLVYYAGHGHLDEETKRGYWVPVDAKGKDKTTFIRNSTIRDEINIIAEKTKHTLLISDSCFSGSLLRSGNRAATESEKTDSYYVKVANKKSVQILAAGGIEFVDDNYRSSGHSPFTYFLLNELKNSVDKLLTTSELAINVIKTVANNVSQTPESGVLMGAGDELGEFIFARVNMQDKVVEIVSGKIQGNGQKAQLPKADFPEQQSKQDKSESAVTAPLPRF